MLSKELWFLGYKKCVLNSIYAPITDEQVRAINIKLLVYSITKIKTDLYKCNDEEALHEDGSTIYLLASNIPLMKYFNGNYIPNSIEELNKI